MLVVHNSPEHNHQKGGELRIRPALGRKVKIGANNGVKPGK